MRDVTAGLAIAAVALPVGVAYPAIAGLPPVVGLYASIKEVDDGIWIVSFMHYDLGAPRQSLSTGHVLYYILTPAEGIRQVLVPRANGSERTPYD